MEEIGLAGVFDLSNFDAGINSYMQAIEQATGTTEQSAGAIEGAFSSMGSAISDISSVMGGVLVDAAARAGAAIVGFIPDAISLASDLNETTSKIGVVFGESAGSIEKWADTAATSMGISSLQALDAAGTYGALFDAMGIGKQKSTEMSEGLVQLAADMGSFNNMDPTVVMDKLRAAVGGETDGLKTLGVNINAAAIEHKALEMGLAKTKDGIDANAKAQAIYALVMEQTKTAQGDFARTSDGLANSTKINAAAWADITATIGSAFLPIQQAVTQAMGYFLSAIAPGVTNFFTILAGVVQTFIDVGLQDYPWDKILPAWLVPTAKAVGDTLDGVVVAVTGLMDGTIGRDFPWENIFPPTIADMAHIISDAIVFISDNFKVFAGALEGVAALIGGGILYSALAALATAIGSISIPIVAVIAASALLGAAWAGDWGGIQEIVLPIIDAVSNAVLTLVDVVGAFASGTPTDFPWEDIAPAWLVDTLYTLAHAFEDVSAAVSQFGSGALSEITAFVSGNETSFTNLQALWDQLATSAGAVFSSLADAVRGALPGWIAALGEFGSNALTWLVDVAGKVGGAVAGFIGPLISSVGEQLPGWIAAFVEFAAGAVSWIGDALPQAITALGDWIAGMVDYIAGNGPSEMDGASGGMVAALIDWIANDLVPKVAPAMGAFLVALVTALAKIALALGQAALTIGIAIVGALLQTDWAKTGADMAALLAKGFVALAGLLATAVGAAVTAIKNGFTSISWGPVGSAVASSVAGGLGGAVGLFTTAIGNITTAIKNAFTSINWASVGTALATAINAGIEGAKNLFTSAASVLTGAVKSAFGYVNWTEVGADLSSKIRTGLESAKTTLQGAAQTVATAVKTGFTTYIQWNADVGNYMIKEIGAGLSGGQQPTTTIVAQLTAAIKAGFTTAVAWLADVGTYIITQIGSGLTQGITTLTTKATEIATSVKTSFTNFDFNAIGKAIVDGISAGVESAKQALLDKIANLGKLAEDTISNVLGINSPAKRMIPIGRAIVEGLTVGVLDESIEFLQSLQALMNNAMKTGNFNPYPNQQSVWDTWINDFGVMTRSSKDFSDTIGSLLGLSKDIIANRPDLFNPFEKSTGAFLNLIGGLDNFNERAQRAQSLLAVIRDNGLDPRAILPTNINNTSEASLALDSVEAAKILQQYQTIRLRNEQLELERAYDLRNVQAQIAAQVAQVASLKPLNFFQATEFDQLNNQLDTLDKRLAAQKDVFIKTGDKATLADINKLIAERTRLVGEFTASQSSAFSADWVNDWTKIDTIAQPLQDMLTKAKELGIDTKGVFSLITSGVDLLSSKALRAMTNLQAQVSVASSEALRNNLIAMANLQGVNVDFGVEGIAKNIGDRYAQTVLGPMLDSLRAITQEDQARAAAMAQYNNALLRVQKTQAAQGQLSFLQDQIDLIDKAKAGGADLGVVFSSIFSGKGQLGSGAGLVNLLDISNNLMAELVKKAQEQLTPQALAVAQKQQQLDKLNQQMDLLQKATAAGLDADKIFGGLSMGINASSTDILTATSRLLDALIKQANDKLQIHSPSQVFADMGKNVVEGLGLGMQKAFGAGLLQRNSVAHGPVSNRTINMYAGGNNIYSGLDEILFESRVQRILERSLGGG